MAFLTADYKDNKSNDYGPLPKGQYEMVIANAHENATKNGAETLQIQLTVRNDLDAALPETNGKYHNRNIWMDNWKRKDTNQYAMDQLQYILEAAGIPEGTALNTIEDFCNALYHKPVNVFTKVEHDDYNDTDRNTVAPWGISATKYPKLAHQFKDTEKNQSTPSNNPPQGATIDIENDDLPF